MPMNRRGRAEVESMPMNRRGRAEAESMPINRRGRAARGFIGSLVTVVLFGCHVGTPRGLAAKDSRREPQTLTEDSKQVVVKPRSRFTEPLLLPRLETILRDHVEGSAPNQVSILVDGLRLRFDADGSFAMGSGLLPMGREATIETIPERLGGGKLFVLTSEEDTWLFRARDFVAELEPLGRIDQPVERVYAGFTTWYLRLKKSGVLVSLDPVTRRLSSELDLPELAETGSIAIVDDGFGAYVDPMRGLLVSLDGGLRFESYRGPLSRDESARRSSIDDLSASSDRLVITLNSGERLGLVRRGDGLEVASDRDARNERDHGFSSSLPNVTRGKTALLRRRFGAWFARFGDASTGGWPVEQAVTRGVRISENVALYLNQGTLHWVTLDEGRVLSKDAPTVPRDQRCLGATGQSQHYFLCDDKSGSTLYRLEPKSTVVAMGRFEPRRVWGAVTDAGVVLEGPCQPSRGMTGKPRSFCGVSASGKTLEFGNPRTTDAALALLVAEDEAVVFDPPTSTGEGTVTWFGKRPRTNALSVSKTILTRLKSAFFLRDVALVGNDWVGYVVMGDKIAGYRVDPDGTFTLGDAVSGAELALTHGPLSLIPDSSGYAHESVDGGRTWQRTRLPIPIAGTKLAIPARTQRYGCTSVGCLLGDWMRLGWSSRGRQDRASSRALAIVDSPPKLGMESKRRPRATVTCRSAAERVPPMATDASAKPSTRPRFEDSKGSDLKLESTPWKPFFGVAPPKKSPGELGFERRFQNERFVGGIYARFAGASERVTASLEVRIKDSLGTLMPWSSSPSIVRFDDRETVARHLAHPRYGESKVALSTVFDVGGERGLLAFDDSGTLSAYLVAKERPLQVLPELFGHRPKRITDFVSLGEVIYLLGSEPTVALFEIRGSSVRIVSEEDYRGRLNHARLRLIRDRAATRLAYLASSQRLRFADEVWWVYPMNVESGFLEAPLRIPLDRGLRACSPDDNGWLIETELDDVAEARLLPENLDVSGRGRALLVANELGLCVSQVSFTGQPSRSPLGSRQSRNDTSNVAGLYLDARGEAYPLTCTVENPSSVSD